MSAAAAMTLDAARKTYAMGLAPALDAGLDPHEAVDVIRAHNAKAIDETASDRVNQLWVGKTVCDGKLGRIDEINGARVKLVGYFGSRWVQIGRLTEWSFRPASAQVAL